MKGLDIRRASTTHWKWLPHEFRKRGYSASIDEELVALPRLAPKEQAAAIRRICEELRARLQSDGIVPADLANPYDMSWFFRFREEILGGIVDPGIRGLTW